MFDAARHSGGLEAASNGAPVFYDPMPPVARGTSHKWFRKKMKVWTMGLEQWCAQSAYVRRAIYVRYMQSGFDVGRVHLHFNISQYTIILMQVSGRYAVDDEVNLNLEDFCIFI